VDEDPEELAADTEKVSREAAAARTSTLCWGSQWLTSLSHSHHES
jgi:hypothetical protein